MKKIATGAMLLGACFLIAASDGISGDKKVKPLCPVKGKPCKKTVSADHNGGKVYFC